MCGNKVLEGADRCPFCQTHLDKVFMNREIEKVIEKRVMRRVLKQGISGDMAGSEIPKVALPEVKETCPACGLELKGGEAKCSRCGVPLTSGKELLECPECGETFVAGAAACPKCGVEFDLGAEAEERLGRSR